MAGEADGGAAQVGVAGAGFQQGGAFEFRRLDEPGLGAEVEEAGDGLVAVSPDEGLTIPLPLVRGMEPVSFPLDRKDFR